MISQLESPALQQNSCNMPAIHGLIQIFTGSQRNFFTNVMAEALRFAGQGTPVLIVQFLKGGIKQGVDRPMRLGQHLEWLRCDLPRCIDTPHLEEAELNAIQHLWQHTRTAILAGQYDLVVLDELSLAIHFGLIAEAEVLETLCQRPHHVDIILTGPEMPLALQEIADQVTRLRCS